MERFVLVHRIKSNMFSIPILNKFNLTIKDLSAIVRERGYEIKVESLTDGFDYTKETLSKMALNSLMSQYKGDDIYTHLAHLINEETLYEIIENGGYESWFSKKARGFI